MWKIKNVKLADMVHRWLKRRQTKLYSCRILKHYSITSDQKAHKDFNKKEKQNQKIQMQSNKTSLKMLTLESNHLSRI